MNSFRWYCGLNVTPAPLPEVRTLEHMFTMVVVFEGVVGPLGVETFEEVTHESWALRLYGLTVLPVPTLLPGYGHNVTSHLLVPIAIPSRSTACVFPALVDGSRLEL